MRVLALDHRMLKASTLNGHDVGTSGASGIGSQCDALLTADPLLAASEYTHDALARVQSRADLRLRLVYIGQIGWDKGLYQAVRGVELARQFGVCARLVIAGAGPAEVPLRQYAEGLGLTKDILFVGPLFGEPKKTLLANADALVYLLSVAERVPLELLEGMAIGVPVIATSVGAIPNVVTDGVHGVFVPRRDREAVALAIIRLAENGELRAQMSAACRTQMARQIFARMETNPGSRPG
jgi:glycosyltransferase involved in cell wall biosynthesis